MEAEIEESTYKDESSLISVQRRVVTNIDIAEKHARSIWLRVPKYTFSYEDILQYALVGLTEASNTYNESRGIPFEAYASYRVRGNILNNLRYQSESSARYYYLGEEGRKEYINNVNSVAEDGDVINIVLFYYLKYFLNADNEGIITADHMAEDDLLLYDRIMSLIERLPEKNKNIIYGLYIYQQSMSEIATDMGMTRARISQIHKDTLERLKISLISRDRSIKL